MYLLFRLTFKDIETLAHDHPPLNWANHATGIL
jgi:hypothetical protein